MNTGAGVLGMADEDFAKLNGPPVAEAIGEAAGAGKTDEEEASSQNESDVAGEPTGSEQQVSNEEGGDPEEGATATNVDESGDKSKEGDNLPQDKSLEAGKPAEQGTKNEEAKPPVAGSEVQGEQAAPVDYEASYKKLMAPLKANGKTIEIKSPEEAVQLMQMGANYTRKMQALAPHRKILLMLENNGLLDEGKLSYLIDLDKKDPNAIKKLVKESGIDPLDIDTSQDPSYQQGNHTVGDEEVSFRTTLDELSSNSDGVETLRVINTQWDQASKEILWKQPDIMELIHEQRGNGIYDRITTELERQKLLGAVPSHVPFLQAYKKIGDDLAAAGAFADISAKSPTNTTPPVTVPVATRKAAPKPAVANNDKATAASSTRTTSRKADTAVNPLALADDDFMKQVAAFQGRV